MEKLMANRLTDVPQYVAPYGFQRGLSTYMYMFLMDMQRNITEAMNQNEFSLGVFRYFKSLRYCLS